MEGDQSSNQIIRPFENLVYDQPAENLEIYNQYLEIKKELLQFKEDNHYDKYLWDSNSNTQLLEK